MRTARYRRPKRGASVPEKIRHHKTEETTHLLEAQAHLRGAMGKTLNERLARFTNARLHLEYAARHARQSEGQA